MFLSMLQLANDKNVKLIHDVAEAVPFHENEDLESMADKFTDSLRVQLLDTQGCRLYCRAALKGGKRVKSSRREKQVEARWVDEERNELPECKHAGGASASHVGK